MIDSGKFADHIFYVGGFPSSLLVIDSRLSKPASETSLGTEAITCVTDSLSDDRVVGVRDRGGSVSLLDMKTKKVRTSWEAHSAKTSLSKPRGVVGLFEDQPDEWITAGCNDLCLKKWDLSSTGHS